MRYLIDTCVISDFIKGDHGTLLRIKSLSPSDIAISSITLMEIHYGLLRNPARASKISPILDDLLSVLEILPLNIKEARESSLIRTYLMNQGTPIGPYDILIAGTARCHNLIMVTANISEFQRIPDLTIENWRL